MEREDIEIMVSENQIAFDFQNLGKIEEESSLISQSLVKAKNFDWIKEEVLFVVVKAKREQLSKDFSSLNLCGKSTLEWVLMAGSECEQVVLHDSDDIFQSVRAIATNKKIIAVFYTDTPLLDKMTFNKICDYFSSRNMNFLQLKRGFIVKSEFIKGNYYFAQGASLYDDNNLFVVEDAKSLNYASGLLYNKIISYHIKNGVIIFGEKTVFIDADVEIESGVIIYPNNIIKGQSIIESDCVLESGNIIIDSIISNGCTVCHSYIQNSKLSPGKTIQPFTKIVNEEI